MNHRILFENSQFLIVFKQALELCVPTRFKEQDQRPCLLDELRKLNCNILPVHRLDYEVSGLVLFAKSIEAQKIAHQWFEQKQIQKFYQAFTEIKADSEKHSLINLGETIKWESILVRGKKRTFEAPHGKHSLTFATLVKQCSSNLLEWHLSPHTGRSHQLRYELFRHGYPILGDQLYGSTQMYREGKHGIALRAIKLDFKNCDQASVYGLPDYIEAPMLDLK